MNNDSGDKKAKLVHRRKEQILAAARHIFAQNGFRRTKIDQIAESLSIGKGTIYRYFKDKKSLFLAVFEQGMAQLHQKMRANIDPITNPQSKIETAVKTYFGFFDNNRELIEIMMQVRSEFKDDYRRLFLALYGEYIVRIQKNLRTGVKMKVFRKLDVEKTADAISATLQGVLQSFYIKEFGPEGQSAPSVETRVAEADYSRACKEDCGSRQNTELLADSTQAVTELLLKGVLERG